MVVCLIRSKIIHLIDLKGVSYLFGRNSFYNHLNGRGKLKRLYIRGSEGLLLQQMNSYVIDYLDALVVLRTIVVLNQALQLGLNEI
jgi:hypothetical protein